MDALTHLFFPLLIAYAISADLLPSPRYLLLGAFGAVPDFDKLLGVPGLGHSLVTVVPICAGLLALDRVWDRRPYATLAAAIVASHLLLDFLDGSGVYLLYPLTDAGVGLAYPVSVTFGEGPLGVALEGWPVVLDAKVAPTGYAESTTVDANSFGFVSGYGVAIALGFWCSYAAGLLRRRRASAAHVAGEGAEGADEAA